MNPTGQLRSKWPAFTGDGTTSVSVRVKVKAAELQRVCVCVCVCVDDVSSVCVRT